MSTIASHQTGVLGDRVRVTKHCIRSHNGSANSELQWCLYLEFFLKIMQMIGAKMHRNDGVVIKMFSNWNGLEKY